MPEYDYHKMAEEVDAWEIVDAFNIDNIYKGGKKWILCPDHTDRHFGSCILNHSGYHCFACGSTGNTAKMLARSLHISQDEAINKIIQYYGFSTESITKEKNTFFPLNKKEICALGLSDGFAKCVKNCSFEKPKNTSFLYDKDGNYITLDEKYFTLASLYKESPQAFYDMVRGKCEEMWTQYNMLLLPKYNVLLNIFCAETKYSIEQSIKKNMKILNNLKDRLFPELVLHQEKENIFQIQNMKNEYGPF